MIPFGTVPYEVIIVFALMGIALVAALALTLESWLDGRAKKGKPIILRHGFGILKRLTPGCRIKVFLTYRCTLSCDYCTERALTGKRPLAGAHAKLEDWQRIIRNHPRRVREVVLSGGEPMFYRDFVPLVDWLTSEGYFVTVYTNLTLNNGLLMRPSWRLRIGATYHRSADPWVWKKRLGAYRKLFRVDVDEIETARIPGSRKKGMLPCADHHRYFAEVPCGLGELCGRCVGDYYAPDGTLHGGVMDCLRDAIRKADGV